MNNLKIEEIQVCKLVLLGESTVGKKSIISRFVDDSFSEDNITTTGASYASKNVVFKDYKNKVIKFEIWDTAGQEKYRSLTQIFYKDAAMAILVFDTTRQNTFNEIKNYWISQIKEYAPEDILLGLAGHKCDLIEDTKTNEEEIREFAKKIGAFFRFTSAKENIGIVDLFLSLGCKYLDPKFKDDETVRPRTNLDEDNGDYKPSDDKYVKINDKYKDRRQSVRLNKEKTNANTKTNEQKKKCC